MRRNNSDRPFLSAAPGKIKLFLSGSWPQDRTIPMNRVTAELIDIFTRTTDRREMEVLFEEIFTPKEISTLTLRWQLLKDLYAGKTQRRIAADHKISLCKITRGAKLLKAKGSYLKKVLDHLAEAREQP